MIVLFIGFIDGGAALVEVKGWAAVNKSTERRKA